MTTRSIASGSQTATTTAGASFALDEPTYASRWQQLIGRGDAPRVDFAKEAAVFLLAGSKPTGGYSIDVRGASVEGETLVVDAVVKPPAPDAIVTQAFTSPFVVVAVDRRDFKDVRWKP